MTDSTRKTDASPLSEGAEGSSGLLRLAASMASAAYTLEVEPFLATGWQDACAQLGPRVTDGLNLPGGGLEALQQARKRLEGHQISRNLTAGLREWRAGDGVKALVMLRRLPDGRFAVAVSFMGSVQLDDWMANFDMVSKDGLHRGFLRRAMAFEEVEESIHFPQAAEQLGLEKLTLRMVVEACAREASPFHLFLTGHSLGAAVMQVYAYRLLAIRGVRRELVQGVGFASPKVAAANAVEDPSGWPLCHVLNSDDCVPNMGAEVHLGQCLRYRAGQELREICYPLPCDEASVRARILTLPLLAMMRDTPSALAVISGILRAVKDANPADLLPALNRLETGLPGVKRLIEAGDNQTDRIIRYLLRRAEADCESVSGHGTDPALVAEAQARFAGASRELGIQAALSAMSQLGGTAHAMRRQDGGEAPYPWIAAQRLDRFEPFTWAAGRPPRTREGRWPG